jgi:N-acetyl sugar amidotransferase
VDSTYLAYLVKDLGLRPLAVHLDNGWNSELAVKNIERTLKALKIDLYTYVIDWHEFRDLQWAFLMASTPDSEIPTDHAIVATLFNVAVQQSVKYILLGTNVISESILPLKWGYGYKDLKYIRHIHRTFGKRPLKTYPYYSLIKYFYLLLWKRIEVISILDYVYYDKNEVMSLIQKKLGWVYYGGKHYESVYTRFFQAYILPTKFNIDKRRAHYSNLICSGQMTREAAIEKVKECTYPKDRLEEDLQYAIKKFGVTAEQFQELMSLPPKTFLDYPNQYRTVERLKSVRSFLEALRA